MNKEILVFQNIRIKESLKKLDQTAEKTLIVIDHSGKLLGTLTDGDVRRFILKGKGINLTIDGVYNPSPLFLTEENCDLEKARKIMLQHRIELLPIVCSDGSVKDYLTWSRVFGGEEVQCEDVEPLGIPAVIMAGGKGTRLDPFTKIFPKALVPINDKPVIEVIIEGFRKSGISDYFLTLNYKAEMIESYFKGIDVPYRMTFLREKEFYGTAGSLSLLPEIDSSSILVSNCDIIVRADYREVLKFHEKQKSWLTIVTSIRHYKIPYGVIKYKKGGEVVRIIEKPEYTFPINTGVYILSKEAIKLIPEGEVFNMNELIGVLLEKGKKVTMYPVNENDYMDIGEWDEYKRAAEKLKMLIS